MLDQAWLRKGDALLRTSFAAPQVQNLSLAVATSPDELPMRAFIRLNGFDTVVLAVIAWITQADALAGGRTPAETIGMLAQLCVEKFKHRSVASLLMALRDGIMSSDKDGKVYGQLTWPTLSLWLDRHEALVLKEADSEHARVKEPAENQQEDHLATLAINDSKDRRIERQSQYIETLKEELAKYQNHNKKQP